MHFEHIPEQEVDPASPAPKIDILRQLTAATGHRINNLLHRINSAEFIVDTGIQSGDMTKICRGWEASKRSHWHINHLMSNLLFFTQDFKPYRSQNSFHELIELTREDVAETFGNNCLNVRHDSHDSQIEVDAHHLQMAFRNVMVVGLLASEGHDDESKNRVDLTTTTASGAVAIQFSFEEFDQEIDVASLLEGNVQNDKAERGMLDMLVSQKIAQAHGGSIQIIDRGGPETVVEISAPSSAV